MIPLANTAVSALRQASLHDPSSNTVTGGTPESSANSRRAQQRIDEAIRGFESVFLHMMLEPLENAGDAFFGGEQGGKVFAGMFRQQVADSMAQTEPLGIRSWLGPTLGEAAGQMREQLLDREPLVTPVGEMTSLVSGKDSA